MARMKMDCDLINLGQCFKFMALCLGKLNQSDYVYVEIYIETTKNQILLFLST